MEMQSDLRTSMLHERSAGRNSISGGCIEFLHYEYRGTCPLPFVVEVFTSRTLLPCDLAILLSTSARLLCVATVSSLPQLRDRD